MLLSQINTQYVHKSNSHSSIIRTSLLYTGTQTHAIDERNVNLK